MKGINDVLVTLEAFMTRMSSPTMVACAVEAEKAVRSSPITIETQGGNLGPTLLGGINSLQKVTHSLFLRLF